MRVKKGREVLRMKVCLRKSNRFSGNFRRHVETLDEVSEEIKRKKEETEKSKNYGKEESR